MARPLVRVIAFSAAYSVYSVYSVANVSVANVSVANVSVANVSVAQAAQQPTFRAGSDQVRIFATVLDHDGRLVTTLTKDQFEIRDEGKPQPLTLFDNTPQPIRLVEMLDVSGSMEGNLPILRTASDALFSRLRPHH